MVCPPGNTKEVRGGSWLSMQSGMAFDLKIANIAKDGQLLSWARNVATDVLEEDPLLELQKNSILKSELQRFKVHDGKSSE